MDQNQLTGIKNRTAVYNFFRENPCHTRGECAKALGLHLWTVTGHAKAIKAGWRPEERNPIYSTLRLRAEAEAERTTVGAGK